ncbi:MAG: class I SAM-dependent methyltransferase [Planctomycetota bacterium]|nr:class I SAM-dependent methyltransferase [Planctomycetota bacterium]
MVDSIEQSPPQAPIRGPHSIMGPLPTQAELGPVLELVGAEASKVPALGTPSPGGPRFHVVGPDELLVGKRLQTLDAELGESDALYLILMGAPEHGRISLWRNALWPLLHVNQIATTGGGTATVRTIGHQRQAAFPSDLEASVLVARRRTHVMSAGETVTKFDQNATGWDGSPGSPGYPHFRWMRRHVGRFIAPRKVRQSGDQRLRILDFGCGAGWTGLEAAKASPGAHLSAFDPSPEMVRITTENAARVGIEHFQGRPGFGEDPPFPAEGEDPFDLVISSGVVSFSPDVSRWLDGLASTLAPGADLIIGDINPHSRGFERRRRRKPLLPVREMNARPREEIRRELEARGLVHLRSGAYQLSRPVPEAMHVNETRLGGVLTQPLLLANRAATFIDASFGSPMQDHFDSWVMHLRRPTTG